MNAYTKAEAKAHDRVVAEQYAALVRAQDRVDGAQNDVHRTAGDRISRRPGNRCATWLMTSRESIEQARRIAAGNPLAELPEVVAGRRITAKRAGEAIQALAIAEEQRDIEQSKLDKLEAVRRANGNWQRFLLVPGGHIHASRSCHSLRATTALVWLPELSGETEADAVAEHGPLLCTKCFPSAPVEWTIGQQPALDPDQCAGSGEMARNANLRLCSPRGTCPACGQNVSVTTTAKVRKHKRSA